LPPYCGKLKDIQKWDSKFFGFTEAKANKTDPQIRILHEVVFESIWDAGWCLQFFCRNFLYLTV